MNAKIIKVSSQVVCEKTVLKQSNLQEYQLRALHYQGYSNRFLVQLMPIVFHPEFNFPEIKYHVCSYGDDVQVKHYLFFNLNSQRMVFFSKARVRTLTHFSKGRNSYELLFVNIGQILNIFF